MSKVRVASFSISIDGFGAGPRQDLQNPLGLRGPDIFSWFFQTELWNKMHGQNGGGRGVDNEMAARAFENVGAWILEWLRMSTRNESFPQMVFTNHRRRVDVEWNWDLYRPGGVAFSLL